MNQEPKDDVLGNLFRSISLAHSHLALQKEELVAQNSFVKNSFNKLSEMFNELDEILKKQNQAIKFFSGNENKGRMTRFDHPSNHNDQSNEVDLTTDESIINTIEPLLKEHDERIEELCSSVELLKLHLQNS
ncbi:uncharacterized protein LOC135144996 [Zophobas morio]|uniref:uncharacterized protein LOC135144996 n=1 Tax=Zophobas morio TaxID=2755281 RepID=UPI0030833BDC